MAIIKLAVKTGLAVGAIYYSKELGVWSNSKQTEKISKDVSAFANPYLTKAKKAIPFEVPLLPDRGEIRFLAKHYYNCGVKKSIHFIYMLPCYTGQLMKKAKNALNSAVEGASNPKSN